MSRGKKRSADVSTAILPVAAAIVVVNSAALYNALAIAIAVDGDRAKRRRLTRRQTAPLHEEWMSRAQQHVNLLQRNCEALHPSLGTFKNPRVHLWALNPDKMTPTHFKVHFRVEQRNFMRLARALKIPDFFVTENRSRFVGTEALLIYMRRMSERSRDITVALFVGRERTEVSRIVKHVSCWITKEWWATLRFDPMRSSVERLESFARVLASQGAPYRYLYGFIDGTRVPIARPANDAIQNAVWNKKYGHNLSYQMLLGVDGLPIDFHGPTYGARHDAYGFRRSKLEKKIRAFLPDHLKAYGDSAYTFASTGGTVLSGIPPNSDETEDWLSGIAGKLCNGKRIAVEWSFGGAGNRFPLIFDKKHNRIFQAAVASQIASAVIIDSAINCLEPSQTSQYFRVLPPPIESFLHEDLPETPAEYKSPNGECLATPTDFALYSAVSHYLDDVEERVPQGSEQVLL